MIVLVPAYEPGARLLDLLDALQVAAPDLGVVVADDGSGPAHEHVFATARARGATVLAHAVNRGKGRALKTGFAHVALAHPGEDVVCADCDGQHSPVDVLRVAARVQSSRAVVLGARRFTGAVPARSRVGNTVTAALFALLTRRRLQDTQTGLRGYPASAMGWLAGVPGERFEYELNALLDAARSGRAIEEVEIATTYLEGNASSHFRPVVDSARIYLPLLAFSLTSFASFLLDTTALLVLHALTGTLLPSVVAARLLSSTANYAANRRLVFGGSRCRPVASAARYAGLAGGLLVANGVLLSALTAAGLGLLVAKVVTEGVLFVASYQVQRVVRVRRPGAGRAAGGRRGGASARRLGALRGGVRRRARARPARPGARLR